MKSAVDPGQGSDRSRHKANRWSGSHLEVPGPGLAVIGPGDYAAASVEGHIPHAADRFAWTRSCRAAAARAVGSAGTASCRSPKHLRSLLVRHSDLSSADGVVYFGLR